MKAHVYELMSYPVTTVSHNASLSTVQQLLQSERVRQLPVLNSAQQVIGIISDRDIRELSHTVAFDLAPVHEFMTPDPMTIKPMVSAERAAHILKTEKIGALPVVEHDKLVGIITISDILDAFSAGGWQSSALRTPV